MVDQTKTIETMEIPVEFIVEMTLQFLGSRDRHGNEMLEKTYSATAYVFDKLVAQSDPFQIFRFADDAIQSAKWAIETKSTKVGQ